MQAVVKAQLDVGLGGFKAEFRAEIANFKSSIIKWMLGLLVVQGALVVILIKLLPCDGSL
jgi:hypothetical protein